MLRAGVDDALRDLFSVLFENISDNDACAIGGELQCQRAANTVTAAGDKCGSSRDIGHWTYPVQRSGLRRFADVTGARRHRQRRQCIFLDI